MPLAGDLQMDTHFTDTPDYSSLCQNVCEICGTELLGKEDRRSCHVCSKVLCVCCSEMQKKLLFMGNYTKNSKGANCRLCDLLQNLNSGENTSPASADGSVPYQTLDFRESTQREHRSTALPPVEDKTIIPERVDNPIPNCDANSLNTVTDSTETLTRQEGVRDSVQGSSQNEGQNNGQHAGTQGETLFNKGQGHKPEIKKGEGHGDTVFNDVKQHNSLIEVESDQEEGQVQKDKRTITKDQGHHFTGEVRTTESNEDKLDVIIKGQGFIAGSLGKVQGADQQSVSGKTATKTKGENSKVSLDRETDGISSVKGLSPQVLNRGEMEHNNRERESKTMVLAATQDIIHKQDDGSETKDINYNSDDNSWEEETTAGDKHEASIADKFQNKHSEYGGRTSTFNDPKYKTFGKEQSQQRQQIKENSEFEKLGPSGILSVLPSESKTQNKGLMNFADYEDEFDDGLEEVEYDNLRLNENNDQAGLMVDTLLGSMFALGQPHSSRKARQPGLKMAIMTMTKPGKISKGQDEFGRDTYTQRLQYRNIMIVADSGAGIQDAALAQKDISRYSRDVDDSNVQLLGLSNQGISRGNFDGSDGFLTELPDEYRPNSESITTQQGGSDSFSGNSVVPLDGERTIDSTGASSKGGKGSSSVVSPRRRNNRTRQAFAHACSGCGRRDCEGNFMKLLREMIVTAGGAGFEIRNVIPDGNCMFAAIVDQLELKKDFTFSPKSLRFECLNYLRENPESDDGTPYALFLDNETWEAYLTRMSQDGEWGDHMMLQAISQVTKRHIQVIHHDAQRDWTVIEHKQKPLDQSDKSDSLYLGHVGEFHYVSLRPCELAKQLHNKDNDSDEESFQSLDVFPSLQNLPNFDDPAKQEMFDENYVDPWAEIPVVHLSYILKKFVPIATTIQSADTMVTNGEMMCEDGQMSAVRRQYGFTSSSSIVLIGDAVQGLYAPYLNERERTEYDKGSEWVDVTALLMPNNCIAYPKDHRDVGEMDAFIETEDTHPGYARLLARYPSQWGMPSSGAGALTCYLPNYHENFKKGYNMSKEEKDYSASQNPASVVSFFNEVSMAIVAPFWPVEAEEWKTRQRKANWPPQKIIDNIVSGGYHFECIPHPKSKNPDIEFRVSFGVAEKLLAQEALSREQRYIFLVFKALCSQEFTEDDLITSAHLKSIFFYACEQLPCDIWVSRPGSCIFYLLEALFVCIQKGNVPDYFLPANNLIDHFGEAQHKQIQQKIMMLRNEPLSRLLRIGQKNHIYNAPHILSDVNNDINAFHEHHSARRSVLEALVPISIDIAKSDIQSGAYKKALEQLQEAYEERLSISTCEDALPFTAFLTQATDRCTLDQQWWFFYTVDQQLHTTMCADLSMTMQPVALEELVGKDVAQTFVGTLIPAAMACKLCKFCSDMAVHLFNTYHTQKCLPFLLFNLNRYREKRQRLAMMGSHGQQQYYTESNRAMEDDFTDENAHRVFDQLFIVYNRLNQLWIFQELLPEYETVCEIINTRIAFTKLIKALRTMGLTEKTQLAIARRDRIPAETGNWDIGY